VRAEERNWELHVAATDHWIWKDEAVFVGVVADAGQWEMDIGRVKAAYAEAKRDGTAMVITAPKEVVQAYVKELGTFGLVAQAFEADVEDEAAAAEEAPQFQKKDWRYLSPDAKAEAAAPSDEEVGKGNFCVVMMKSEHISLQGDGKSNLKFRAYIEMAADSAKKFAPEEGELNTAHMQIIENGKATVLADLPSEAAEAAAAQLRQAGFEVEVQDKEVAPKFAR